MTRLFPDKALFSGAAVARCSIPFVCVSCVIVLPAAETQQRRPLFCRLLSLVASPLVSSTIISPGLILPPSLLAPFPPPPAGLSPASPVLVQKSPAARCRCVMQFYRKSGVFYSARL